MNKLYPAHEVMRVYNRMHKNGAVVLPGLDGVITYSEIKDDGRFLRCELDWDKETAKKASEEFGRLTTCLGEIGRWHQKSDGELKWEGFDENTFKDPETLRVWEKYFKGYPNMDLFPTSNVKYFPMNDIGGYEFDLFSFMCFLYTRLYVLASSEDKVMKMACTYLATAYIIYRFARKVELLDFNKPASKEKSIFPRREKITDEDNKLFGEYLVDKVFSAM